MVGSGVCEQRLCRGGGGGGQECTACGAAVKGGLRDDFYTQRRDDN